MVPTLKQTLACTLLSLAVLAPSVVRAESNTAATSTVAADAVTEGEVKKVDKEQKKITIKHGEIKNLGMPPMTMIFKVKDPAMLDAVKSGDKVNFVVEKLAEGLTVVMLKTAQ
ncbi:copper-binding protein [Chitinimonas naiadis]